MKEKTETRERTVTLAGKNYTIRALPMKPAREWRQKHSKPLQAVIGTLQHAGKMELQDDDGNWNVGQIAALFNQVGTFLLGSVDMLVDALFDYSPVLQADRERIESAADDTEAMTALWEVVQLAYPFGTLMALMPENGQATNGT